MRRLMHCYGIANACLIIVGSISHYQILFLIFYSASSSITVVCSFHHYSKTVIVVKHMIFAVDLHLFLQSFGRIRNKFCIWRNKFRSRIVCFMNLSNWLLVQQKLLWYMRIRLNTIIKKTSLLELMHTRCWVP